MKLALLFFSLLELGLCSDVNIFINILKAVSIGDYFGFFVVLNSEEETSEKLFYENLARSFRTHFKYSMVAQIPIEKYKPYQRMNMNKRCLKILNGRSEIMKRKFLNLSKEVDLGDGDRWLLFLDNPIEPYLNSLTLPFDVELITASVNDSSFDLKAPYKVAKNYPLRIHNLGRWTETKGLDVADIELDVSRRDMEGFKLIAGTINYPPVTSIKHYKDGTFSVHGYLTQVWAEVSEKLNFTYEYILPPDQGVGSQTSNGSWNGLMGMMIRNEIDVIVTSLIMTQSRIEAVDFSVPTMTSGFQVFFLQTGNQIEWGSYLRPFTIESWLAILSWFFALTLLLSLIYSICCSFNMELRLFKEEYTIPGCLFIVFRAFTNQGNNRVPQSVTCRIVLYLSYFFMGMVFPLYSGALISYLAVQGPIVPFHSLEDMLKTGTHKIMPAQKTADYNFFSHSKEPLLQNVFKKLIEPLKESTLPRNPKEGIEMVCKIKNVAYFGCELSARMFADEYFLKNGCKFMTFEDPVTFIYKGIVFPKNSPYSLGINSALKRMILKGLVRRYENEVWSQKIEIKNHSIDPIKIRHVVQIYCVFLGGVVLSVFIFIFETFHCNLLQSNCPLYNTTL